MNAKLHSRSRSVEQEPHSLQEEIWAEFRAVLKQELKAMVEQALEEELTEHLAARAVCPAKVKTKGAAVIPALRFFDIVRSAPDGEIRCRALENHWVQVTYERSSFKLVGLAKNDFPKLPDAPKPVANVAADVLANCVEKTSFAMSADESRYVLNAALLKLRPDVVTMAATDGHRLALVERTIQMPNLKEEISLLVPRKALASFRRLAEEGAEKAPVRFRRTSHT